MLAVKVGICSCRRGDASAAAVLAGRQARDQSLLAACRGTVTAIGRLLVPATCMDRHGDPLTFRSTVGTSRHAARHACLRPRRCARQEGSGSLPMACNSSKLSAHVGGAAPGLVWLRESLRTCTGHAVVGKRSADGCAEGGSYSVSLVRLAPCTLDAAVALLPYPSARKHHER